MRHTTISIMKCKAQRASRARKAAEEMQAAPTAEKAPEPLYTIAFKATGTRLVFLIAAAEKRMI